MQNLKNLTNSPYAIRTATGETVMLPSRGEIDVDVDPQILHTLRICGYITVSDVHEKRGRK